MPLSREIPFKIKLTILAALAVATVLIWQQVFAKQESQLLLVEFFDVGQGDSIFIEAPNGNQVLIDGGPSDRVLEKLSKVMGYFDKSLDLVILTHPDSDHLNGLIEVLKHHQVGQILASAAQVKTAQFDEWQKIISKKQILLKYARAGQRIKISPQIYLDIVYPFTNKLQEVKKANNWSVVSRLCYSEICFLLPGDIEAPQENILAKTRFNLKSQVLKLAHHGSKTSSTDLFLAKIKPDLVVISVGKNNRFGQPHLEVLERLKTYTSQIRRTDDSSDIKLKTDGKRLMID